MDGEGGKTRSEATHLVKPIPVQHHAIRLSCSRSKTPIALLNLASFKIVAVTVFLPHRLPHARETLPRRCTRP